MQKFFFLTHENNNAYFNLASEEYLLKQTDGYYFYLWINDPAVIVGINQNAIEEVNLGYTENNDIKVVRRLTGGGTVYHDKGNLCYTVIAPFDQTVDTYREFTKPVIKYLNSLGVKAEFSGRNDILVDGKKISGNAQTVYNGRIMHHGTILFDTDMSVLEKAINPSKIKMESKGIKSVRARVTNVKEYLEKDMDILAFKKGLAQEFLSSCTQYNLTEKDKEQIEKLIVEKYSNYEWNIGRSPKGKNTFVKKFDFGIFNFTFDTENGLIKNATIHGDFFNKKDLSGLTATLEGVRYEKSALLTALKKVDEYINGANGTEIVNAMFND